MRPAVSTTGDNPRVDNLFFGIFAGAVGWAYIVYGQRQTRIAPVIAGVLLCAYPYFVDGWVWLCVIGAALMIAPFLTDF